MGKSNLQVEKGYVHGLLARFSRLLVLVVFVAALIAVLSGFGSARNRKSSSENTLALEARIEALEARIAHLNAQNVQEKIQARAIEIVDAEGKVLIFLRGVDGSGRLTTYNKEGKVLANLSVTSSGAGSFIVEDGKGNRNLVINAMTGGAGGALNIYNGQGQRTIVLEKNEGGAGVFATYHSNGKMAIEGNAGDAGGVLTVFDKDEKVTGQLPR